MAVGPISDEERAKNGKLTEEFGIELVCCVTQSLYRSRKSLREATFETAFKSGKKWLRRTLDSAVVRQAIGLNPQQWVDINQVFYLALPVLEAQSIPSEINGAASTNFGSGARATTCAALMMLNYDNLMKDLERLNDILLIARNCLATTQKAQNLAGESLLDQQVLKLVDLCVRVTARGYDGEAPGRAEQTWANIIGSYKKLLVTSLQFLHNFIMKNEQRKLLLWLDLFANSKVANEYALPIGVGRELLDQRSPTVKPGEIQRLLSGDDGEIVDSDENKAALAKMANDDPATVELVQNTFEKVRLDPKSMDSIDDAAKDSLRKPSASSDRALSVLPSSQDLTSNLQAPSSREDQSNPRQADLKSEKGDAFGALRTPESAAITLQIAKDQLMARLADPPYGADSIDVPEPLAARHHGADRASARSSPVLASGSRIKAEDVIVERQSLGDVQDGQDYARTEARALDQEPEIEDECDAESDFRASEAGDQQRGLLTDIPLVLGPQEIEALPMMIQIGICSGLGSVLHGRDMQGMRCNILLAGDAGRNLLRELLIFIAAWDLQDDEVYFRLMMQIMGAILENGLMPYAYQTFSEVKDIVSPAQSMVIKILTQLFRGKQSASLEKDKKRILAMMDDKVDEDGLGKGKSTSDVHADESSRKVDVYIVRYIFTIFRSSVIPETCALIYLQGQIKAGAALPEDFPLNLWDMERVYEGVYQFLEFFAVLTESEEWKDLLVKWEIVSELVTLLRELEASIPKAPINAQSIPQTVAEAQAQAIRVRETSRSQQSTPTPTLAAPESAQVSTQMSASAAPAPAPAPMAVERPFDLASEDDEGIASPPHPISSDSIPLDTSDQGSNASNDPSDFEWRNLKKLVILVLSSLVWKSPTVQSQIRHYGGVEMVLACCNYDANNPYIREHAVMCLRFLLEGSGENKAIVEKLQELGKMPPEEVASRSGSQADLNDSRMAAGRVIEC